MKKTPKSNKNKEACSKDRLSFFRYLQMKLTKKIKDKSNSRRFRGMPVREAKATLKLQPDADDIKNAKRGDPTECAYALCLKRTLHTDSVFIYKNIAYVGSLDDKGNPIFERYMIRAVARRFIDAVDNGDKVMAAGFVFHPPTKKASLDYRLSVERRPPGSTHKSQQIVGVRFRRPQPKETSFSKLRRGTGMVQFIAKDEKEKVTTRKQKHGNGN